MSLGQEEICAQHKIRQSIHFTTDFSVFPICQRIRNRDSFRFMQELFSILRQFISPARMAVFSVYKSPGQTSALLSKEFCSSCWLPQTFRCSEARSSLVTPSQATFLHLKCKGRLHRESPDDDKALLFVPL